MVDTESLTTFGRNLVRLEYRPVMMTVGPVTVLVGGVLLFPGTDHLAPPGVHLSAPLLALLAGTAIVAGVVKGVSGFGYALTTTPVFASVLDPTLVVVALAIPPWMINVFQVGETNTGPTFVRRNWTVLLAATVGAVVGVTLLARYSAGPIVPLLIGLLLLGYVVFELAKNFVTVDRTHHPAALTTTGLLEGVLLGTANLGPLLAPYYHTFLRDVDRYVGSLTAIYGTIFTVRLVYMFLGTDLLTPYRLWVGCVVALVGTVGVVAGTALRRLGIDEDRFARIVVGLLFVVALNLLNTALGSLNVW
jgi:uncharacterized membrane protein YfcA